jgi:hypothetical protein
LFPITAVANYDNHNGLKQYSFIIFYSVSQKFDRSHLVKIKELTKIKASTKTKTQAELNSFL